MIVFRDVVGRLLRHPLRSLALLPLVLVPADALAHLRSQSFSSWHVHGGQVRLSFTVQSLEATRLGALGVAAADLNELLVTHLRTHIVARANGDACRTVAGPQARTAREGYLRVEWRFACPPRPALEIENNAFFDVAPSHVHHARVRAGNGPPAEYLFTDSERRRVIEPHPRRGGDGQGVPFLRYTLLGIQHIAVGLDHIAFLLALLLLCRRVRDVALAVTGFTLGHSLTLGLAALRVVEPRVPVIESLIGFTVALVAVESVAVTSGVRTPLAAGTGAALLALLPLGAWGRAGLPAVTLIGLALFTFCYVSLADSRGRAAHLRPLLTAAFGLIHGFGFASVLLEVGLPTDRLVAALLGFNVGVEIGQLAVVAGVWGLTGVFVRCFPRANYGLLADGTSAALCALGVYWFIARGFGG